MIDFFGYIMDRKFRFLSHCSFIAFGLFLGSDLKYSWYFLGAAVFLDILYSFFLFRRSRT